MTTSDTLLLFDIDGTLLSMASREHALALRAAIAQVHGISEAQAGIRVDAGGRTDGEIARLILLQAGVDARAIDERASEVAAACCERYARSCPADLSDRVIAGIPELVAELAARPGIRLSLVTGNYEPVARLKLTRAGLGGWFPNGQGGFGSDSEDRTVLPEIARRRAGDGAVAFPREGAIVIGDTPRDIACARADGLRCVAVATGTVGIEALGEADGVAADGLALGGVLDAVLAG